MLRARLFVLLLAAVGAGPLLAQHAYTDDEIGEGGRLYEANCSRCHGAQGNTIAGIDLGLSKFKRPMSESELIRVIRAGIPNTTMAPVNISEAQAGTLVAYMRSMTSPGSVVRQTAALPPGDAARGKPLVEGKGSCLTCHRVNGNGSRTGPDLSDIGTRRRQPEIELALLIPNAEVQPVNRTVRVVMRNGEIINGRILNHDTLSLQLIDSREQLRSFLKSTLREYGFIDSPMPSYRDKLTTQELADVVSYLVSLKGQVTP